MIEQIKQTAEHLKRNTSITPEIGIILGTGLGGLVNEIEIANELNYQDIPNFPVSTVEGHSGKLIFGKLGGKNVVAMQGRFHFYEGYTMQQVVFPVRVMKFLGIEKLILSNASGGVNPDFEVGDLMIITDQINLFSTNPLIGKNYDDIGPRFPDMSEPYNKSWIEKAKAVAKKNNIKVQQGVYAGLSGPAFETPAEYKYIHTIGADCVGMSTVPEVIAARHASMNCFAISVITDLGVEGKIGITTHQEVQHVAKIAEKKMTHLIKEFVKEI
jgi:purine-nucleoside phosphorylase